MKFLIACFPKSGSTYLYNLIGNLSGFEQCVYLPPSPRREQELSDPYMGRYNNLTRQVAQLHVRASGHTLELLEKFGVTPIVLVRNIHDCVVSLADHMSNESVEMPMAYLEPYFNEMSLERKIDAIVDLVVPWYFNFYVSWWRARPGSIVTYEDLILGGLERQHGHLEKLGLVVSLEELKAAYELTAKGNSRLNVGVSGRGAERLSHGAKSKILRMSEYYRDIDFTPMGLAPQVRARLASRLFHIRGRLR
jgi:hypothetical protein